MPKTKTTEKTNRATKAPKTIPAPPPQPDRVLVLRNCHADMTSYDGFKWPESGPVKAPDWSPQPVCGKGLHGLLWAQGDVGYFYGGTDAKWLVVSVDPKTIVDIDGKVKYPSGDVVFCGARDEAVAYLAERAPKDLALPWAQATAGDAGTAIAGECGKATAGDRGTATAGNAGTATAGECGKATAGECGKATAGYAGTAIAGYAGTATAGNAGTATAGDRGTAIAGYAGTATAGDRGTAIAGYAGTATAGYAGTATAGECGKATAGYAGTATAGGGGELHLRWRDGSRYRTAVFYVGENGIEPNVAYKLDEKGNIIKANAEAA